MRLKRKERHMNISLAPMRSSLPSEYAITGIDSVAMIPGQSAEDIAAYHSSGF
jgi:hypothetical protein